MGPCFISATIFLIGSIGIYNTLLFYTPQEFSGESFDENKSRAAYWDGRNDFGERVASGLYLYTLTAGEFSANEKNADSEVTNGDNA